MDATQRRRDSRADLEEAANGGSGPLARARTAFLVDEPVASGVVRPAVLESWTRSRDCGVPTDRLQVPYDPDLDFDSPLARAGDLAMSSASDPLANEPVSAILCDARGSVLRRRTGDRQLEQQLDRVSLAPGFSYAEQHVGTNGIGTALTGRSPAQVFGHEHYVEHLEDLACVGVPIRHLLTDEIVGVLDITCRRTDVGSMMSPIVQLLAARVEAVLLEQSGRRELALLHEYVLACRRHRGAVIGVGDDLLMLNDRARELLGPGDQASLVAAGRDALASERRQVVLDLPSGLTARVLCTPSFSSGGASEGVLQVLPVAESVPARSRAATLAHAAAMPTVVGSGALWTRSWQAVDRHFQAREWLVLEGEPGTGKATLAKAVHQSRTPAAHLRVLDADDFGPRWLADLAEDLGTSEGSLVLTHVDRLPPEGAQAVAEILEPYRESTEQSRPWLAVTLSSPVDEADGELAELLSCFPRTVAVPPLRHHIEDVAELVPFLLARLSRGRALSCSQEVLSLFMRNPWPGNVRQLDQVLHRVTAQRRSGAIGVGDLPPDCRATRRWVLTPLEAIECDAIVEALSEAGGNKASAARLLGMSRATIYRKIRGYGISLLEPDAAARQDAHGGDR